MQESRREQYFRLLEEAEREAEELTSAHRDLDSTLDSLQNLTDEWRDWGDPDTLGPRAGDKLRALNGWDNVADLSSAVEDAIEEVQGWLNTAGEWIPPWDVAGEDQHTKEVREIRLPSTGLIYTPGMIQVIVHMWRTGDHKKAVEMMAFGWPELTVMDVYDILQERFRVDGDTVVLSRIVEPDSQPSDPNTGD